MDQFYPNGMIHEDHFSETMETVVRPALRKIRKDRMVAGADGKKLFVSVFPSEGKKGTVIIHHGFTESVEKFSEVIYALNQAGYTVGMHEARGHGRSYTDPGVDKASGDTYVAHFDDYVEDLHALMGTVYRDLPRPYFLLCHSMGGAVGALYLEKYPGVFEKAVLSSPMIAPSTYGIPKPVVMAICTTMTAVGKGNRAYALRNRKKFQFFINPEITADRFQFRQTTDFFRNADIAVLSAAVCFIQREIVIAGRDLHINDGSRVHLCEGYNPACMVIVAMTQNHAVHCRQVDSKFCRVEKRFIGRPKIHQKLVQPGFNIKGETVRSRAACFSFRIFYQIEDFHLLHRLSEFCKKYITKRMQLLR